MLISCIVNPMVKNPELVTLKKHFACIVHEEGEEKINSIYKIEKLELNLHTLAYQVEKRY